MGSLLKRLFPDYTSAATAIILTVLILTFANLRVFRHASLIGMDVIEYYGYLPAVFIHHDVGMNYASGNDYYQDKVWGRYIEGKGFLQRFTMGLSFAYLPFFLIGHVFTLVTGGIADGYTYWYRFWLAAGTICYVGASVFLLRKILKHWFDDHTTAITILLIFLGTNLQYYSASNPLMSHAWTFSLTVLFLHTTIRLHEDPGYFLSIVLGITGGMITLIRPTNILFWLVPLLWGIHDRESFSGKIAWLRRHAALSGLTAVFALLIIFPQLLYWKHMTGEWLHWSYGENYFHFAHPHVLDGLFSFRNGWFIYTPVMLLAIGGFFFLKDLPREFRLPLFALFLPSLYLITAWWCWWYGWSFGNRAFIDLYAMLSVPLAVSVLKVCGKGMRRHVMTWILLVIFCGLNNFQTMQARKGIIHGDSMTPEAWRAVFLKQYRPPGFEAMLVHPDYKMEKEVR